MADKKISQLTNITGANLADDDEFVVVDTSVDETKAITWSELKEGLDTGTGFVRITGDTMTGDLTVPNLITSGDVDGRDVSADGTKLDGIEANADVTDTANVTSAGALMTTGGTLTGDVSFDGGDTIYGDNDKAIFGAGSDLQIYHNGGNSYIEDVGTGDLVIKAGNLRMQNADGTAQYILADNGGAVQLRYNGGTKLATTSTGIDVTGTVTADGLTVDTKTLYVDATGNKVGIGTNSPRADLSVYRVGATDDFNLLVTTFRPNIVLEDMSTNASDWQLFADGGDLQFRYGDASTDTKLANEAMRIDNSGNVGIGTTSPDANLEVENTSGSARLNVRGLTDTIIRARQTGDTGFGYFSFGRSNDIFVGGLVYDHNDDNMRINSNNAERMRIDSSGNVLVGKTTTAYATEGTRIGPDGVITLTRDGTIPLYLNRLTSNGTLLRFDKDGTTVGSIGSDAGVRMYLGTGDTGLRFIDSTVDRIAPYNPSTGAQRDNAIDLGEAAARFDDIFATNGTIQTSDANEKQQIAELTVAEMQAAKAISKLFKTFKWNDSVDEKGDAARIHTGVIAQEVEAAMTAAGLDAGRYAFFTSSTWWESTDVIPAVEAVEAVEAAYEDVIIPAVLDEEGNEIEPERTEQRLVSEAVEAVEAQAERTVTRTHKTAEEAPEGAVERTRKGIRYPQLLSFIGAATEQRLAYIEARLDAAGL